MRVSVSVPSQQLSCLIGENIMTTQATTATNGTSKKGAFNCFPLKFLFQAQPAEQAKPMADKVS